MEKITSRDIVFIGGSVTVLFIIGLLAKNMYIVTIGSVLVGVIWGRFIRNKKS